MNYYYGYYIAFIIFSPDTDLTYFIKKTIMKINLKSLMC